MTDERLLLADTEARHSGSVDAVARADALFRTRMEHSLKRAYRLAAVILSDERDAEDVTHDAVERAWRARRSLRDPERFDAWFQRIVVNSCRDRLRRHGSRVRTISGDGAAFLRDVLPDPGPDLTATVRREALAQALSLLPDEQRIVVILRFYLDLEIEEIARRSGTRVGTVKSRLHRALKQLRAEWEAAERRDAEVLR